MKGAFITIEGIDGSGKDTLAARIKEYLESKGIEVVLTREPGDAFDGKVRDILMHNRPLPLSEMFLFMADRHEHVERVIRPALEAGKWVISVRFADSSMAYQGARGVDRDLIERLNMEAIGDVFPQLTILLDLPASEAMNRIKGRGNAVEHFEREEFLSKVRGLYLEDAAAHGNRIIVVDATISPDEIFRSVKPYLDKLIDEVAPTEMDISRAEIADAIIRAIDRGMHAFLVYGPWGCGHKHMIRKVIYTLVPSAKDVEDEPYGIYSPDVMVVYGEKPSSIKIDMVRAIGDFLDYRPIEAKYKVVVIDDASFMTLQASNALLKILEEPPEWGIFMLYTSYPERVLSTIRSRCAGVRLDRFSTKQLAVYIEERFSVSREEAETLARLSEGCPDRVEHILQVLDSESILDYIKEDFYKYVPVGQSLVEDNVMWDKLFLEVESLFLQGLMEGKQHITPDDVLMLVEWEGMLKANVQKKLIADLIYWRLKEGIERAHIS
ncbi:dTMP kinase [bacterium 3DAC]|nr:dTMP kinase [bacterium 3DAC]